MNTDGRHAAFLPAGHIEGFADTFRALYAAVYRSVAEGKPGDGYPTFADGHDEMLVCEAVARSAKEARWVEVERAKRQAGARSAQ
jgi:predicted dehydrogenase